MNSPGPEVERTLAAVPAPRGEKFTTSEALILAAIVVPFLAWLTRFINLDFWYDEAYTLTHYVFVPLSSIVTDYSLPNNHVLFSLLSNLYLRATRAADVGTLLDHPWMIRVLPLSFTLAALAYTYAAGRRFLGRPSAQVALAVLVTTIPFYNFAVQVRGYSLSFLLVSALLYHGLCFDENERWCHALGVLLATTLALYAIPLNFYFVLALGVGFILSGVVRPATHPLRRRLLLVGWLALGAGFAARLYAPMLAAVVGNRFVLARRGLDFATLVAMMPRVLYHFLSFRYLLLIPAAAGLIAAARKQPGRPSGPVLVVLSTLLFCPFILSVARGDQPFQRVFVNLAPAFSLLLGALLVAGAGRLGLRRTWPLVVAVIAYCNTTFWFGERHVTGRILGDINAGRMSQDIMYNYFLAYYQPRQVAAGLVRQISLKPGPVVCTEFDRGALPLYLEHAGIKWHNPRVLNYVLTRSQSAYVVTARPRQFLIRLESAPLPGFVVRQLNESPDYHGTFLLTRVR